MELLLKVRIKQDEASNTNSRYRLWLNEYMLVERIYPTEIGLDFLLEETLYIEYKPGSYTIKLDNLNLTSMAKIIAVSISDIKANNLSCLSYSFQIQ